MSVDHMSMVFEAEGLNSAEKCLLLACTNRTDAHGYCWPGVERLAADAGMSTKTVKRTRKELEARNIMRHQRRTSRDGRSTSNLYRINLQKLAAMRRAPRDFDDNVMALEFDDEPDTPSDQAIGQSDPPEGDNLTPSPGQSVPLGGVTVTPNPSEEPSVDPSVRSARESAATDDTKRDHEDGRTDEPSPTEEQRATAQELAEHANLARVGARRSQVRQVAGALAAALALGYTATQLRTHLRTKVNEARTVRYVLGALEPSRLADMQPQTTAPSVPPVCGQCDARDRDGVGARTVIITDAHGIERTRKCPQCHPAAIAKHSAH